MNVRVAALVLVLFVACGGEPKKGTQTQISSEPVSVRGWVTDVEGEAGTTFRTIETEQARRQQLFQSMNVWVENSPYVSGGLAENGSFLLLDVPPGKVTITFSAPGAPSSQLVMENVPGNADVLIPSILLKKTGVTILQPNDLKVRMAASIDKPKPTGRNAIINGHQVPVVDTPMDQMADRRDWPVPPGYTLATVK